MSARQKEQAERAALVAHAASLKQRQELEMEECRLKARKEQLEIETAIAASTAKIKVLEDYELESCENDVRDCPIANLADQQPLSDNYELQLNNNYAEQSNVNNYQVKQEDGVQQTYVSHDPANLCEVMLKQNDITKMLVQQHRLSHLPQRRSNF